MSTCNRADWESVPLGEARFHPHSFADPAGRVFWWRGQLYRGIRAEQYPFFAKLFDDRVIQGLVEQGLLVESNATDLAIEGYAAVISHKAIPFVSYPQEWCAAMLKDAALTIINLVIELAVKGLTLKDAHPWNLLFDGCNPVFVDLTSIAPFTGGSCWPAYDEFCHYCLYPLILMAHGHDRMARSLLPQYGGVRHSDLLVLTPDRATPRLTLSRRLRALWNKGREEADERIAELKRIRDTIENINVRVNTPIRNEQHEDWLLHSTDGLAEVKAVVDKFIFRLKPNSILEICSGPRQHVKEALCHGSRVVSFNTDPTAVARLYEEGRSNGWPILPLVMDFMMPTPSMGYSEHYSIAATNRFKCEMVLALGLVQRAVLEYSMSFDLLVEGLASFSTRWLIVDFPKRDERALSEPRTREPSWYTQTDFVETLKKRFRTVTIVAEEFRSRVVLVCEK